MGARIRGMSPDMQVRCPEMMLQCTGECPAVQHPTRGYRPAGCEETVAAAVVAGGGWRGLSSRSRAPLRTPIGFVLLGTRITRRCDGG